ncbi:HNH endonuclease [Candidatus Methylospira mobilis]|nr:HNH endonuclease [Candidatus Methylospira mobilis]
MTPRECARLMGYPDSFRIPVSDTQAYKLCSQAAVVPMVEYAAKLIALQLNLQEKASEAKAVEVPQDIMTTSRWTKEQLKLAFHLYCQLPFGRLHSRNPEIIQLAQLIGRTPSAVAMKLVNFASLDPAITSTGRAGLGNASALDKEVWAEFHADWEKLALECLLLNATLRNEVDSESVAELDSAELAELQDFFGETKRVLTEKRVKQHFFRRAVLSSYRGRCCISGLSDARLLMASHIMPWSYDKKNRLNPSNGLCLSAIHDKAFDRGLITLSDDHEVMLSEQLKRSDDVFVVNIFLPVEGRKIEMPEKFIPNLAFISHHRNKIFVDAAV